MFSKKKLKAIDIIGGQNPQIVMKVAYEQYNNIGKYIITNFN